MGGIAAQGLSATFKGKGSKKSQEKSTAPRPLQERRLVRTSMGLMNEALICIGPALKMKDVRVAVNSTAVWSAFVTLLMGAAPMMR